MSKDSVDGSTDRMDKMEGIVEPKELISRLGEALQEPETGTAAPVLVRLLEVLEHRFEREDDDFDEAIQRAPWLTPSVLQLKGQHDEMLKIVSQLHDQMQDGSEYLGLNEQLNRLVDLYHEHAHAECSVLQDSCHQEEWDLD
jgi:hypothetical protein